MTVLLLIAMSVAYVTAMLWVLIHKRAALTYLKNIFIGIDQLANAILGGDPDETISSVAGKARNEGQKWGCLLCKILDWLDKRHCDGAIEKGEGRRSVWKMNATNSNPKQS